MARSEVEERGSPNSSTRSLTAWPNTVVVKPPITSRAGSA